LWSYLESNVKLTKACIAARLGVDNVATCSYIARMKTVGIRDLKNRLSEYVREVRSGEEILVTDRGQVVAELRPPTPPEARASFHPGLAALARRGILVVGKSNAPDLYPPLPPILVTGSAAELLTEEREERR